ncbi:MAG: hypothetical protein K2R93_20475 [Gemmatimonadaceae bacterium]|nr:hypothetical protein [Gemmatimonadaceae bacterium]
MPLHVDPHTDAERAALRAFHALLDGHPAIDEELIANPRLLEDPRWLDRQPRVVALFARHPGLPDTLRTARHVFRWREVQRALRPAPPERAARPGAVVRAL